MRTLSRGGVEGPGRSPGARGTAAAVCRTAALRYTTWLERGQSRRVDEVCRRQSVGRRHHRDFLISRLTASAVRITPPAITASAVIALYCMRPRSYGRTTMRYRSSIGVVAFAAALLMEIASAAAHDETKYPDLRGQWTAIGGSVKYVPDKPSGLGQQPPLPSEY